MKSSALGLMVVLTTVTLTGCADAPGSRDITAPQVTFSRATDDRYIVVMERGAADPAAVAAQHGVMPRRVYRAALRGFAATLTEAQVAALDRNPNVAYVEPDGVVTLHDTQVNPDSWGLDRVDQQFLPLDASYTYPPNAGAGVHAYIIDSGVNATHDDFGGRASFAVDFTSEAVQNVDCLGHGTHVSGTVGGTTYGVAKLTTIHAVRVFGCIGNADWSTLIAGIDWVTAHGLKPGVINMSLSGPFEQAANDATQGAIDAGFTVTLAAGNSNTDACGASPATPPTSPASTLAALTVAASTISDGKASFSSWGGCVDLYAPGLNIKSLWIGNNFITATISGTSMSAPHVAGAAALLLGADGTMTPAQVHSAIVSAATPDVITGNPVGTPNLLLRVAGGGSPPPPPPPPDDDASFSVSCSGLACTFTAVTTGGWSFGDGSIGDGLVVSHTYASRGHYIVRHTVGAVSSSRNLNCNPKRGCR